MRASRSQDGLTLVELMVTMTILATMIALSTFNIGDVLPRAQTSSVVELLMSDLRLQQLKAMAGDTEGRETSDGYGVYFETNQYTLFHGYTYVATNSANYTVDMEDSLEFTTIDLPNQSIVYTQATGEVYSYDASASSVILENTANGSSVTFTVNEIGTVEAAR